MIRASAAVLVLAACGPTRPDPTQAPIPAFVEVFTTPPGVYVRSLAVEDATNSLYVGTSGGVVEVDLATGDARNQFAREQGLANEYVFGIGVDPDGYKWFGTNAGGMSRYKDGQFKTFFPMHGLADYWVYAFANHPDGSLWVGTWAGANRVDRKTLEFTTYKAELINEWVYALDVDAQGRVWFGTEGGVSMLDGTTWTAWTHADGLGGANVGDLPSSTNTGLGTRTRHDLGVLNGGRPTYNPNYVFSLVVADDETVWAGTWGGGVAHLVDGKWSNLTTADGLSGNLVYSMLQDRAGAMWFGTDNGLTRYDGVRWTRFGKEEGLRGEHVYAIAQSPDGDLWVGTRGGVTRLGVRESKANQGEKP